MKVRTGLITLLSLACLGVTGVFAQIPEIVYPPLVGDYAVGRTTLTLNDTTREEVFTTDATDTRQFPITIYYPVTPSQDLAPSPYAEDWELEGLSLATGFPPDAFAIIKSHSIVDAQPAPSEGGFPTLLFSPGFGTFRKLYTALLEQIASYGYVVVAIEHPYSLGITLYPDGSYVAANAEGSNIFDETSYEAIASAWTGDTRFVLDELERLNSKTQPFVGMFNLEQIGAFGHSFGGATATQVMIEDERVDAAIDLDGSLMFETLDSEIPRPFLWIESDESATQSTELVTLSDAELQAMGLTREQAERVIDQMQRTETVAVNTPPISYRVQFGGFVHNTFAHDAGLWSLVFPESIPADMVGSIHGERALTLTTDFVTAFFDQYVRQENTALDDLVANSADYPEVTLSVGGQAK